MVRRSVAGEYVETEVSRGIPPDGVGVIGRALGVVPFDQEPGTLQSVVVRLSRVGRARPGEVDGVEDRFVLVAIQERDAGRRPVEVGAKEGPKRGALLGVKLGGGYAFGVRGVRQGIVIGIAQTRCFVAGVTDPLQLCLLNRVWESLVPPDPDQRDHPITVRKAECDWR